MTSGSTARRDVSADLDKQQAGLRLWKVQDAWMLPGGSR